MEIVRLEKFVVGQSEDTEAEYGQSAEGCAFTILSMFEDEIYCIEGFHSLEGAKRSLSEEDVWPSQIMYL